MCYTGLRSNKPDVPRHLTENQLQETLTSHVWQSCILKDLKAQPTHSSLFKGIEAESAPCHLLCRTENTSFLFSTKTSMSGEEVLCTYRSRFHRVLFSRCKVNILVLRIAKQRHKKPAGLFLYASFCITECCESDDEGKWSAVFHGSFKEIMASTYIAKIIFDKCQSKPNRKLISHTIKELFGWQRKAA